MAEPIPANPHFAGYPCPPPQHARQRIIPRDLPPEPIDIEAFQNARRAAARALAANRLNFTQLVFLAEIELFLTWLHLQYRIVLTRVVPIVYVIGYGVAAILLASVGLGIGFRTLGWL